MNGLILGKKTPSGGQSPLSMKLALQADPQWLSGLIILSVNHLCQHLLSIRICSQKATSLSLNLAAHLNVPSCPLTHTIPWPILVCLMLYLMATTLHQAPLSQCFTAPEAESFPDIFVPKGKHYPAMGHITSCSIPNLSSWSWTEVAVQYKSFSKWSHGMFSLSWHTTAFFAPYFVVLLFVMSPSRTNIPLCSWSSTFCVFYFIVFLLSCSCILTYFADHETLSEV
jgi:hypothetical protein